MSDFDSFLKKARAASHGEEPKHGFAHSWIAIILFVLFSSLFLSLLAPVAIFIYYKWLKRSCLLPESISGLRRKFVVSVGIGLSLSILLLVIGNTTSSALWGA